MAASCRGRTRPSPARLPQHANQRLPAVRLGDVLLALLQDDGAVGTRQQLGKAGAQVVSLVRERPVLPRPRVAWHRRVSSDGEAVEATARWGDSQSTSSYWLSTHDLAVSGPSAMWTG